MSAEPMSGERERRMDTYDIMLEVKSGVDALHEEFRILRGEVRAREPFPRVAAWALAVSAVVVALRVTLFGWW